jgi:hypothetical protein
VAGIFDDIRAEIHVRSVWLFVHNIGIYTVIFSTNWNNQIGWISSRQLAEELILPPSRIVLKSFMVSCEEE